MSDPVIAVEETLAILRRDLVSELPEGRAASTLARLERAWSDGTRRRDLASLSAKLAERAALPDEVLKWLRRVRDLAPDDATVWNAIGRSLLARGEAKDAIGHFLKAQRLAPKSAEIRLHLALAQRAIGDVVGQAGNAAEALRLSGGNSAKARILLAQAFMAQGNFTAAATEVETLIAGGQDSVALVILQAELDMIKGLWSDALLRLAECAEQQPAALGKIDQSFDGCMNIFARKNPAQAQAFIGAQGFGAPRDRVEELRMGPVLVRSWQGGDIDLSDADAAVLTKDAAEADFVLWLASGVRLAPGAINAMRDALLEEPSASVAVPLFWGAPGPQGISNRLPLTETAERLTKGSLALGQTPLAVPVAMLVARDKTGLPSAPPTPAEILRAALDGRHVVISPKALAVAPTSDPFHEMLPALLSAVGGMNLMTALHLARRNAAKRSAQHRIDTAGYGAEDQPANHLFVSHAQNFEDLILHRALRDVSRGTYIDIGASHPRQGSVSLAFHRMGWRGVHVEPLPKVAALVQRDRPGDTVLPVAVRTRAGPLVLHEVGSGVGLSTLDADIAESHRRDGWQVRSYEVETITLGALLDKHGSEDAVHWLKIDVEGAEMDVLSSWAASPVRPWIVAVEATRPGSPEHSHQEWEHLLTEKGYSMVMFDGLNRYYLAPGQQHRRAFFAAPPNVFDHFTTTPAHWAQQPAAEGTERGGTDRISQLRDRLLVAAALA